MLYFGTHHRGKDDLHHAYPTPVMRRAGLPRWMRMLGVLGILCALTSCVEPEGEPRVVTVSVEPSTIEYNHYNGLMDVSILIANFEGEIVDADAFIQLFPDPARDAPKTSFSADVSAIELQDVPKTWFQGLPPGTYQIGARVVSDAGESIEQLDLATVTVTD